MAGDCIFVRQQKKTVLKWRENVNNDIDFAVSKSDVLVLIGIVVLTAVFTILL